MKREPRKRRTGTTMTVNQLREAHRARPFRPFRLHVADGRTLPVECPERMAYTGGQRVFVGRDDDSFDILDLTLITGIEIGNGKRSKRKSNGSKE